MEENTTTIRTQCPCCGLFSLLEVYTVDLEKWRNGNASAQDAFPYLDPGARERLISGICPECWAQIIG